MKRIGFLALFVCLLAGAAFAAGKEDRQPPRPRMLFVFAPDADNKPLQAQYDRLQKTSDDLEDGDILTVYVIGDRSVKVPGPDAHTEPAANLRKLYHVDADAFRMVLVGKDGWQKMRWNEPTDVHQVLMHASEMPTGKKEEPPR